MPFAEKVVDASALFPMRTLFVADHELNTSDVAGPAPSVYFAPEISFSTVPFGYSTPCTAMLPVPVDVIRLTGTVRDLTGVANEVAVPDVL